MDIIGENTPTERSIGEPLRENNEHTLSEPGDIEPIEEFSRHDNPVLFSLGISDDIKSIPAEQQENIKEVTKYVSDALKAEGKQDTITAFKNKMESLRWELGFDRDTDPTVIIDKIANIVKSWRSLSFIRNPDEKRSILMRLGRAKTADEMDKIVFTSMESHKIWQ